MMPQVMLYSIAVAAALGLAGACVERVAGLQRLPRRTGWLAVMLLSVLFPAAMILLGKPAATSPAAPGQIPPSTVQIAPQSVADAEDFMPLPRESTPAQVGSVLSAVETRPAWRVPVPTDTQLVTVWLAASAAVALFLCGAALTLRRRAAGWQPGTILGHEVLLSEVTGPALLGVLRPRIVVPRWLQQMPDASQALVLEHEREHVRARDPLLVLAGWVIIASAPWSLPLWWQWRRLRQAIEFDCDARVMRSGAEAINYAEVLLAVTRRATRIPAGALAMTEPVHALERRIADLTADSIRHKGLWTIAMLVLAASAAGLALALDAPALPARTTLAVPAVAASTSSAGLGTIAAPGIPQVETAGTPGTVSAPAPVLAATAPAPDAREPAPARAAPADSSPQPQWTAAPFKVRLLPPVQQPVEPDLLTRVLRSSIPRPADAPSAAAKAKLERYSVILRDKLGAVPGVELVTEDTSDVQFTVVMYLGEDWEGVYVEAFPYRGSSMRLIWTSYPPSLLTPRITAFSDGAPAEDPYRDMDNLVDRMRVELFPPDRNFLDRRLSDYP